MPHWTFEKRSKSLGIEPKSIKNYFSQPLKTL
jgi:hypothetical protein